MKMKVFVGVGVFLLGCFGGYFFHQLLEKNQPIVDLPKPNNTKLTEVRNTKDYQFISPLLECDEFNPSDFVNHTKLKIKVQSVIRQAKAKGSVNSVSFYYRDLNNGPWIGIDENDTYSPSSMMKVPILMAVLKLAETETGLLDKQVVAEVFGDESSQDFEPIEVGKKYRMEELLERMIILSDNRATSAIRIALHGSPTFEKTWAELGFEEELSLKRWPYLSAKRYSTFFRVLYNSTFLNRASSEYALELLSRTEFNKGIRAGLPNEKIASSKFGVRVHFESNDKELHECAIVYDDTTPYLLCIMTRGVDVETQASVISEISELVYQNR